jgi:hypothetical protein
MRWDAIDVGDAVVQSTTVTHPLRSARRPFLFAGHAGGVSLPRVLVAVLLVSAASQCAPSRASDAAPAGGSTGPTAAPAGGPHAAALDETIVSGSWQYTVTRVARQPTLEWNSLSAPEQARGIWVILHVRAENLGSGRSPLHAMDFQVQDAAGTVYTVDERLSAYYSAFHRLSTPAGTYPPHVAVEVGLVFDVDAAATGWQLQIAGAPQAVALDF